MNPDRVFLDTNIIWNINTFGEEITDVGQFDVEMIMQRYGRRVLGDLLALKGIYEILFLRNSIEFVADPESINELAKRTPDERAENRMIFADELLEWWSEKLESEHSGEDFMESTKTAVELLNSGKLDFLPDSEDRFLIASAVSSKSDVFLTMDYTTILAHSNAIKAIVEPMRVERPREYLGYVP